MTLIILLASKSDNEFMICATGSVTTRTDHQQQSLSTRCASVPAYAINSASRTGNGARCPESFQLPENNRSQSVDSAERGRAQFPSKLQNGATGANAGRSGADDSSSKSSSSSTNVDQDISGFGGTKAEKWEPPILTYPRPECWPTLFSSVAYKMMTVILILCVV